MGLLSPQSYQNAPAGRALPPRKITGLHHPDATPRPAARAGSAVPAPPGKVIHANDSSFGHVSLRRAARSYAVLCSDPSRVDGLCQQCAPARYYPPARYYLLATLITYPATGNPLHAQMNGSTKKDLQNGELGSTIIRMGAISRTYVRNDPYCFCATNGPLAGRLSFASYGACT